MAPKEKVNAEQKEFLLSYASEYREVQKHGTFAKFWPRVFLGWFSRWPEEEKEEIKDAGVQKGVRKANITRQRKVSVVIEAYFIDPDITKYIKCWYRNHALPKARSHALPPEEVEFVQTVKEKTKRCPQLLEHYQNQYYKEKIAQDVSDKLTKDGTKDTLGVVREKTKEAWRLEDVAVKARITEEHVQLRKDFKQAREEKKRLEKEEAKARTEPTPSSYAA
ncbi:hypothetical protein EYR38_006217 [Pleurotus pulmonarius]|nr:hypothetical protein EYR38_006217 [Pleurotus pulmonarius]